MLIDGLGWTKSSGPLGNAMRATKRKMVAACGQASLDASSGAQVCQELDLLVKRPAVCLTSRMPQSTAEIYLLKGDTWLHEASHSILCN